MKSDDFNEIYNEHAKMIHNFLLRMCKNEHLAEDLMQDTFLKAIERIDTFDKQCKLSSWLCQIAKNTYFDYLRKKKNQVEMELCEENLQDVELSPEDRLMSAEATGEIHRLIHKLEDAYKEVFLLRFYANLSFKEIGNVFGKSEVWGRVTYLRGKERLLQMLKERE